MSNYSAWNIKKSEFPEKGSFKKQATFLIGYAILAPSSHNTQPWKFAIGSNYIDIFFDDKRALLYSDRTQRQAYISLGCSLLNLIIAAEYFGYSYEYDILPEYIIEDVAVRVYLHKGYSREKQYLLKLYKYLTIRRTNRHLHLRKAVPATSLSFYKKLAGDKDVNIFFINNKRSIGRVAEVVRGASKFAFSDKVFKKELSRWVASVYTRRFDGIPLNDFGMPKLLTLLARVGIKKMPASLQSATDYSWVKNSTSLLVLATKYDNKENWLKIGMTFQKVGLNAARDGISIAPMAGIIEHEPSRNKLRKILRTKYHPGFFARFGYTSRIPPHSPRRPVSDVII